MASNRTELAAWRKSSYSSGDGGNCVEVAADTSGNIPIRDSKRPGGPAITITAAAWVPFIAALKAAPGR